MRFPRPRRFVAGLVSLAMVGGLGMLATQASAASPPAFTGPGIGPQPKGLGMGSKAALAQEHCNENGRTSLALAGSTGMAPHGGRAGRAPGRARVETR